MSIGVLGIVLGVGGWGRIANLFISNHVVALTTRAVCDGGEMTVYADGSLIGTHDSSGDDYGTFTLSDSAQVGTA